MMAPKAAIKIGSWFNRDSKAILPSWNKVSKFDNTRVSYQTGNPNFGIFP